MGPSPLMPPSLFLCRSLHSLFCLSSAYAYTTQAKKKTQRLVCGRATPINAGSSRSTTSPLYFLNPDYTTADALSGDIERRAALATRTQRKPSQLAHHATPLTLHGVLTAAGIRFRANMRRLSSVPWSLYAVGHLGGDNQLWR